MAPVLLLLHLGSISPCMFCGRNGVYIKQRTSELLLPMHFVFNVAFLRDIMQEHSPIKPEVPGASEVTGKLTLPFLQDHEQ